MEADTHNSGTAQPGLRFVPGLAALGHYDRAWLRYDPVAGVSVAAVALRVHGYASLQPLFAVGNAVRYLSLTAALALISFASAMVTARGVAAKNLSAVKAFGVDRTAMLVATPTRTGR